LNITLSPPDTSNIIWLSVPNLILLSASLPISKLELTTEVIPVCAAVTATSPELTVIPVPAPTVKVTAPELPPPVKPLPAVTPVISPVVVDKVNQLVTLWYINVLSHYL
jgi:hypothetical protein